MAMQSQLADHTTKDPSSRQPTHFGVWKKVECKPMLLHAASLKSTQNNWLKGAHQPGPKKHTPTLLVPLVDKNTKCYHCHKFGHFSRNCLQRTKCISMHTLHTMTAKLITCQKSIVHLPDSLWVFMLADTSSSHNYAAGDFLEFLQRNSNQITEHKHGSEVIQTASGKITTALKLVTFLLTIAGQWVMLKTQAEFVWHNDKPAPSLKLQINGHMVQVSCDMSTEDLPTKSYDNPLYELTEGSPRKGAAINMKEPQKHMFNELKAVVQNMVLGLPQLGKHYYIESDASDTTIGAVLSQVCCDWQGQQFNDKELPPKSALQPVAFFSKQLSKMERNYSAREREFLGGIASMTHFCCYIDRAPGRFTWVLVTRRRSALIVPSGPTTLKRLTAKATNSELAIKPGMAEAVTEIIACESHPTWLYNEQKALSIAETTVIVITLFERACSLTKALHNKGGHQKQSTLKNLVMDWYGKPSSVVCENRSHWFPRPPPQQSSFIGEADLRRWDAMEAGDTQSPSNKGDPPASLPLQTKTMPPPSSLILHHNPLPTAKATTMTPVPKERVSAVTRLEPEVYHKSLLRAFSAKSII
ncbi:hypothetical protein NDA14_002364 [Ustilago hordei]|nr:hypothetical protein NDA14_002364 [Ustilago hordei]